MADMNLKINLVTPKVVVGESSGITSSTTNSSSAPTFSADADAMVLSYSWYGTTLPTSGVEGQIFFKLE